MVLMSDITVLLKVIHLLWGRNIGAFLLYVYYYFMLDSLCVTEQQTEKNVIG